MTASSRQVRTRPGAKLQGSEWGKLRATLPNGFDTYDELNKVWNLPAIVFYGLIGNLRFPIRFVQIVRHLLHKQLFI
jgi:hypothetical protein